MVAYVHVVDGEPRTAISVAHILGSAGHLVCYHRDGNAFLAALADAQEGPVLLEVARDGTGLDTLRTLRRRGVFWPVIATSITPDVALAVEVLRAGACDFIVKPFDHDELVVMLRLSSHAALA